MKPKARCCALLLRVRIGVPNAWAHVEKLGTVHVPVACTAEAQQQFDAAWGSWTTLATHRQEPATRTGNDRQGRQRQDEARARRPLWAGALGQGQLMDVCTLID